MYAFVKSTEFVESGLCICKVDTKFVESGFCMYL